VAKEISVVCHNGLEKGEGGVIVPFLFFKYVHASNASVSSYNTCFDAYFIPSI